MVFYLEIQAKPESIFIHLVGLIRILLLVFKLKSLLLIMSFFLFFLLILKLFVSNMLIFIVLSSINDNRTKYCYIIRSQTEVIIRSCTIKVD